MRANTRKKPQLSLSATVKARASLILVSTIERLGTRGALAGGRQGKGPKMNYLRSAAVLASVSLVALVAGCSSEAADVSQGDAVPSTEVMSKGLAPRYTPTGPVCPDDYSPEKPAFYQVQASRVAKYLFGGNDPFDTSIDPATGDLASNSKEFGEYGLAKPDMTNPACQEAAKCMHLIHDSLYPPASRDQKTPTPTSTLKGGPLDKACGLVVDTFKMELSSSVPASDWNVMRECSVNLDGCWGYGVSGFFHGEETTSCDAKDADQKTCGKRYLDFDPGPADLTANLAGYTGATASAVYTNTGVPTTVVVWPSYFYSGGSWPAGTPCSNGGMTAGQTTTKAIVLNSSGTQRKCM